MAGALRYPIIVARGALAKVGQIARKVAPAHRYAIITDSVVGPLYAAKVAAAIGVADVHVLTFAAGENHKTRETWARLTDELISLGCARDTTIIALGGGVVGDVAGFVAATFMRGVPLVQVPTTLLAMIDASIGGKTGVDTPHGKNLVGSFHDPAAVVIDPQTLATLALEQLRAGLAEAIKHGVIADNAYFGSVERSIPEILSRGGGASDALLPLIVRSIEIKSEVVSRDEREGGLRKILNFGHTIGHAVETLSSYSVAHGEAVAIGMAVESRMAEMAGFAEPDTFAAIGRVLGVAGLPDRCPPGMTADRVIEITRSDKKARLGRAEYSLPARIGRMAGADTGWTVAVDENIVREALA